MNHLNFKVISILLIPFLLSCNPPESEETGKAGKAERMGPEDAPTYDEVLEDPPEYRDIEKSRLLGKIRPQSDSLFVEVPVPAANREGLFLRSEALEAFLKMRQAAKEDGIALKIISAFRSFNHQKWLWENKFTGKQNSGGKNMASAYPDPRERTKNILNYSAMPGTSRHHWGTDVDINSLNPEYFQNGKGKQEYNWLKENAAGYGFYQPYTANREGGYSEEHWHWSYMPLAGHYYYNFREKISYKDIQGFEGSRFAPELKVIERHVLSNINPACKDQM
ncbi:MAG: D-alanyl-D-alanine carboxypeptidase family protein [Bacteroidales bacterium]